MVLIRNGETLRNDNGGGDGDGDTFKWRIFLEKCFRDISLSNSYTKQLSKVDEVMR